MSFSVLNMICLFLFIFNNPAWGSVIFFGFVMTYFITLVKLSAITLDMSSTPSSLSFSLWDFSYMCIRLFTLSQVYLKPLIVLTLLLFLPHLFRLLFLLPPSFLSFLTGIRPTLAHEGSPWSTPGPSLLYGSEMFTPENFSQY